RRYTTQSRARQRGWVGVPPLQTSHETFPSSSECAAALLPLPRPVLHRSTSAKIALPAIFSAPRLTRSLSPHRLPALPSHRLLALHSSRHPAASFRCPSTPRVRIAA